MLEWITGSLAYSLIKDGYNAVRGRKRRLTPKQVLELRQKWKPQFEAKLWEKAQQKVGLDVIIRDVKRMDHYPEINEHSKGISPWFKVGLMGTYDKGILVGLRWEGLTQLSEDTWRVTKYAKEEPDLKTILIGYIRYENIEAVDWQGDEYYGTHIYCYFDARKKEPYEKLAYCTQGTTNVGTHWYTEVASYEAVRKESKRAGLCV